MLSWLEQYLRPTAKRIIYKRLYRENLTLWERFTVWVYAALPGCHPLVKRTIKGE